MTKQTIEQYEFLNNTHLETIQGGWFPWGLFFSGTIGALDGGGPTLDQLNGKWPKRNPPRPCSPYGTGGTPNACNGL